MGRKNWTDRLNAASPHVLRRMTRDISGMKKGELALLPSARMVDDFIRTIPKGKAVSIVEMRRRLARRQGADVTCPVYTGYHLRTVAEAAFESLGRGTALRNITPIWRVLDESAPTLRKLSAENAAWIAERRAKERF